MRLGIPIRRAIDDGAMVSGGETIAPKTKPTGQGRPNSQWAAAAVTTVVNTMQPTASSEIGPRLSRTSGQLIATADM